MIIQTTARVPEAYRDLILSVCARLRVDAGFGSELEAFMGQQGAIGVQQLADLTARLARLEAVVYQGAGAKADQGVARG